MITRYTRPELGGLWSDEARMETWRRVEVAACEELPALLGGEGPGESELEAIRAATFTVAEVNERERVTDHDVAAFVDVLGASAGSAGRWIHFGLTSSDVLDTALALQLHAAGEVIVAGAHELVGTLAARAREQAGTLCVGRTHAKRLRVRGSSQRGPSRPRLRAGGGGGAVGRCGNVRGDGTGVREARARPSGPGA
jgi:adenylosuccinate lyase